MSRLLYIALLFCIVLPDTVNGQGAVQAYEEALEIRRVGDYQVAADLLVEALSDSASYKDAALLLGELYLRELRQPKQAEAIIRLGLSHDPDDNEYRSLDLMRRFFYPPAILPNLHDARITNAAKKVIAVDSSSYAANLVLGTLSGERYRSLRNAVSISGEDFGDLDEGDIATLQPVLSGGNRTNVTFESRGVGNQMTEVEAVSKSEYADEYFDRAEGHLEMAISKQLRDRLAYKTLATLYGENRAFEKLESLAQMMMVHRPTDANGFLYSGFAQFYLGNTEASDMMFEDALALLPNSERFEFENIDRLLSESQKTFYEQNQSGFASAFWLFSDPRLLTTVNERRVEHYARMVYADLRFGEMLRGTRGWQTEPGQVIVRYGLPTGEATFSTRSDAYYTISYPEFGFRFMDLAKAGKMTFFSPKASSAPSFEAIRNAWNDDTIRATERFRDTPQITRFDEGNRRRPITHAIAYFRNPDGRRTDLVVNVDLSKVNSRSDTTPIRTGIFLLKDGSLLKSVKDISESGSTRISSNTLPSLPGIGQASIEFDAGPGRPIGFETTQVELPAFSNELALSSVVGAYAVEELDDIENAAENSVQSTGFLRHGHWIAQSFDNRFKTQEPVYVYFEIYNLNQKGSDAPKYTVEAFLVEDAKGRGVDKTIRRISRRRSNKGVAVSFEAIAQNRDESVYLQIQTSDTNPGEYIVVIRITDSNSGTSDYAAIAVELY